MSLKVIIFIVTFGAVFYLVHLFYPHLQQIVDDAQSKRVKDIAPRIDRMFVDISFQKLLLLDFLSPIVCGGIAFFIVHNFWFTLSGAVVGSIIPAIVVKQLERLRRQKFAAQIVDGLMILSSSLKAGLSLMQSFETLVEEMPAPISQEFGLVMRQMQMGVSLEQAIGDMKRRMQLDELDLVVTAMLVARESGGDLTITFSRVITTIQERNKLIGRVKALCIQGKLQGVIMSLLPILFGLFVYKMTPGFFDIFFTDNIGKFLFGYAIVSEILGIFFIRKLSKVDI